MKVFLNLLGIVVVIGLIFLISWDRKNIRWKAVGKAIIDNRNVGSAGKGKLL